MMMELLEEFLITIELMPNIIHIHIIEMLEKIDQETLIRLMYGKN